MNHQPEYIGQIAASIKSNLEESIHSINDISERTNVLAINGRIEAARSGEKGVGFRIVANEFNNLNQEIASVSVEMKEKISEEASKLINISEAMAKQVRGQRLSQIALSIMDVIDRNLYERTCDVRWWATDPSLVEALIIKNKEAKAFASKRLGIILDSYTVYLDLFLADENGFIVANGRPDKYDTQDKTTKEIWFKNAMKTENGREYSFQSTHKNSLVNNEKVLIYGCRVDKEMDDQEDSSPLGVLGIFFNWKGLVDAVLGRIIKIDLHEDINVLNIPTEIYIIDNRGLILASTNKNSEGTNLKIPRIEDIILSRQTGHELYEENSIVQLISYGYSPGFETYRTGWYCIIIQSIEFK